MTVATDSETSWGNPKLQAIIDSVKAARVQRHTYACKMVSPFSQRFSVTINTTWLARVKEVIGYCLKDGLYVIMNTHHELWFESYAIVCRSPPPFCQERALWKVLAKEFPVTMTNI